MTILAIYVELLILSGVFFEFSKTENCGKIRNHFDEHRLYFFVSRASKHIYIYIYIISENKKKAPVFFEGEWPLGLELECI